MLPSAPDTHPPVLDVTGLRKRYGATTALDGVALAVGAGEVVALMGANGAGKSTLVKSLCGAVTPDAGRITVRGRVVEIHTPAQAQTAGIIAVHQSIADVGVPTLSVEDNLLLDLFCTGQVPVICGIRSIRRIAAARAAAIGLTVDLDRKLDDVSIADRQLVAIARAVALNPAVLIFDEPTASLSASEAERLFAVIERLKARGVAILYISHKTGDIERLADRIVVLRDGAVAARFARPFHVGDAVAAMIGRALDERPGARRGRHGPPVLAARGLRLRRGETPFDFTAHEGEVLAITGPVGAGKTSLAGTIFGLWPAAAGALELDGRRWAPRSPADAIAAGVFYAGEDRWRTSFFPASVPFASIAGTIGFPFLSRWSPLGGVDRLRETRVARESIARFGIKARAPEDRLTTLSGGNQQKVVLARWHAEPSRLLLLDEPFQGVDVGAREDIIRAIRASAAGRATIVFLNDYEEALETADRILVMDHHYLGDEADPLAGLAPSPETATSPTRAQSRAAGA